MKELLTPIIAEYIYPLVSYIGIITATIIVIIIRTKTRKNKYMQLKREKFSILGIVQKEYEHNDDKFINDILEDNERMSNEIKLLKEKYDALSMLAGISAVFILLILFIQSKLKKLFR